uniref:Uncharacterized protein n=1 Tax=Leptobrachium leishanense TaxID=445787 RepID=A0A8C5QUJ8_9ANUR
MVLLLFIYIRVRKLHVETWTGIISTVELGAQCITLQLALTSSLIPRAFAVATSVRVGHALGAGNMDRAKLTWKVSVSCAVVTSIICGLFVFGVKDHIAYLFTQDREIVRLVSRLMLFFAPYHVPTSIANSCNGLLIGSGNQVTGAIFNAVAYYVVGLPVGIALMFAAKLGIAGFWSGMILSVIFEATSFLVYINRLNWSTVREKAQVRAGLKFVKKEHNTDLTKTTINQEEKGDVKTFQSNYYGTNGESAEGTILQDITSGDKPHELTITQTTNIVGELLSVKQLIIRRSLAVVSAVTVLVIGILIKFLILNQ